MHHVQSANLHASTEDLHRAGRDFTTESVQDLLTALRLWDQLACAMVAAALANAEGSTFKPSQMGYDAAGYTFGASTSSERRFCSRCWGEMLPCPLFLSTMQSERRSLSVGLIAGIGRPDAKHCFSLRLWAKDSRARMLLHFFP